MEDKKLGGSWIIGPVIFVAIFILVFLGFSAYKEFRKNRQVESEIELLKKQAEKIERENMSLEERIAYLGSQDYQKNQAKDKLDLQEPGENLVVITQDLPVLSQEKEKLDTKENNNQTEISHLEAPNFLKWWNYFIK